MEGKEFEPGFVPLCKRFGYCVGCIYSDSECEYFEDGEFGPFCLLYGKYLYPLSFGVCL